MYATVTTNRFFLFHPGNLNIYLVITLYIDFKLYAVNLLVKKNILV